MNETAISRGMRHAFEGGAVLAPATPADGGAPSRHWKGASQ